MLAIVVAGAVQVEGGSVAVALPETLDRLTLVVGTPGAVAQMDAAAVGALRDLLAEAAERMTGYPSSEGPRLGAI